MLDCDYLIIGSGQTGLLVTQELANLGKKIILVEQEEVGGTYLYSHDVARYVLHKESALFSGSLRLFKIYPETYSIISNHRKKIGAKIINEIDTKKDQLFENLSKNKNIRILKGKAEFASKSLVEVNSETERNLVTFDNCVIAVGKGAMTRPKLIEEDDIPFLHQYNSFVLSSIPSSLAIVGITADNLLLANIYANLGIKVLMFERLEANLVFRKMDRTGFNFIIKSLLEKQVEFFFNTEIVKVTKNENKIILSDKKSKTYSASDIYFTVKEDFEDAGLNLKKVNIDSTKRGIVTKKDGKTNLDHIWAFGECSSINNPKNKFSLVYNFIDKQELSKSKIKNNNNNREFFSVFNALIFTNNPNDNIQITKFNGTLPVITIGLSEIEAKARFGPNVDSEIVNSETHEGFAKLIFTGNNREIIGLVLAGDYCQRMEIYAVKNFKKSISYNELKTILKAQI